MPRTADERRELRRKKLQAKLAEQQHQEGLADGHTETAAKSGANHHGDDDRFVQLLSRNEDDLILLTAEINKVYQEALKKDAPFMTFMLCGMQSTGKSTIMERFLNAPLNIVQEGTGTRCPLDTTCIHDETCTTPVCDLQGHELKTGGSNLPVEHVFKLITEHNQELGIQDRFSTEPLRLIYRANNVQNMRFVDTPGIIATKGQRSDNREDIKRILQSEMRKANTKLCVLLEPKEYATNSIIDFCDETFGERSSWKDNAVFLMTKFDQKLEDSRTGSKANNFFKEYFENSIYPHLVCTSTLEKEDLPPRELYLKRCTLLETALEAEATRFDVWRDGHRRFQAEHSDDEELAHQLKSRLGFGTAKDAMRAVMLKDTTARLPEVLSELRKELTLLESEKEILTSKIAFTDPQHIKLVVSDILYALEKRILSYLDGDLHAAVDFDDRLQDLYMEIDEEEASEWANKHLNHFTQHEDEWRDAISDLEEIPNTFQASKKFLGGKQVHRAVEFFKWVMVNRVPDPMELKDIVSNATGYMGGNLGRENWERAVVQTVKYYLKKVAHPGINFLVKHIGYIFRRLFSLALDDVKVGDELSHKFRLLPNTVEKHFLNEFDKILWDLLSVAANKSHTSLEPMYSTIEPDLPTFHVAKPSGGDDMDELYKKSDNESFVKVQSKSERCKETYLSQISTRFKTFVEASGTKVKELLCAEAINRGMEKKYFLQDERSSMTTDDEAELILKRAFEYIVALMEFVTVNIKFQINHYLFLGFKEELSKTFKRRMVEDANWEELVQTDDSLAAKKVDVEEKIRRVQDSLREVERLQRRM